MTIMLPTTMSYFKIISEACTSTYLHTYDAVQSQQVKASSIMHNEVHNIEMQEARYNQIINCLPMKNWNQGK